MKLLTKEILDKFKKTGSQDGLDDPVVIAKFFDPTGSATWWCTEYNAEDEIFFCYVTGLDFDEWEYVGLEDLKTYRGAIGLGIERDLYLDPTPMSQIKALEGRN